MRRVAKAAPGRPPAFNRSDIVDCALKLLDRDGADALTLRGLARELGTVLGTLCYHFENLADLEDAVAARLLERLPVLDAARPVPLRAQCVELGLALIAVHSTHPHLRHITGAVSIEIGVRQLQQNRAALQALGLSEDGAVLCVDVLQALAHSHGTELHRLRTGGPHAMRSFEQSLRQLGKLPAVKLTAASFTPAKMAPAHRQYLGFAVDTLLRSLAVPAA